MKLTIDTDRKTLHVDGHTYPLYSREAFERITQQYVKVGWNEKYVYTFTWAGRPLLQLPDDILRLQEVIWSVKPDLIIETGVAGGGSLAFYASLLQTWGGRVIGIEKGLYAENRIALEQHEFADMITLIEGDSLATPIVKRVVRQAWEAKTVMVCLDSNHSAEHVYNELLRYAPMVTVGSWVVVMDGLMGDLADVPRGKREWATDNPSIAIDRFMSECGDHFQRGEPEWLFNESDLQQNVTHYPNGWLKRVR